jgi:hypothetical protein
MTPEDLNQIKADVADIKSAILGEGFHKDSGLIKRVNNNEKRLTGHDKILWMLGGAYFLVLIIAGIVSLSIKI